MTNYEKSFRKKQDVIKRQVISADKFNDPSLVIAGVQSDHLAVI